MGLDSVELLMRFEDYFGVKVPDLDAEKVVTIQDMVNLTAQLLALSNRQTTLKNAIRMRLEKSLVELHLMNEGSLKEDVNFNFVERFDKIQWLRLEAHLQLQIPRPYFIASERGAFGKWYDKLISHPHSVDTNLSLEKWATIICISNYKEIVNPHAISDQFEIYVAIAGITIDQLGVDVYDLHPESSFSHDLGMD